MKTIFKIGSIFIFFIVFLAVSPAWAQAKRAPNIAYDSVNNRYLMVWEEDAGAGKSNIVAQFRNPDGTVAPEAPITISAPRPTQGCFYSKFDSENGAITTPTNCPLNSHPSVAYNNGQYIVTWEVHGTASAPSTAPDNQFVTIFARIVDANNLQPLPGWDEGAMISRIFIAANNAESKCGTRHACNDGQIQAWSQSINPQVAPRFGAGGFVVTWQTNKDFIGCADPQRRKAWAVYGRYVDQSFATSSTSNPPIFDVFKDDSSVADTCQPPTNVDNGSNPHIAFNQATNDFVIVYQVARASGGNASIGAKRVTLDATNLGAVTGSLMPDIVTTVNGGSLTDPQIISFNGNYILIVSDGTNLRAKTFTSDSITSSTPTVIALGGGTQTNPHVSSNLGAGGQRPSGTNTTPERLVLTYEQGGNIFAVVLDGNLNITGGPLNLSTGISTSNSDAGVASDYHDFVGVWQGQDSSGDNVFAGFISSGTVLVTPNPTPVATPKPTPTPITTPTANNPPTAPVLDAQPADGVTWAPTRLYLSWAAATDPDAGDTVNYDVYFAVGTSAGTKPYKSGVTNTNFIIQASTDGRAQYDPDSGVTAIYLSPSQSYAWKICARDNHNASTCSPTRAFNTDNSVVGWWRFDENPAGPVCAGGGAGETVCDYSGNNNHGVPNGGPVWLPPPDPTLLGGALQFDGVDDYVSVAYNPSMDVNGTITISCKINPSSISASTEIFSRDDPAAGPYTLSRLTPNKVALQIYAGGTWKIANADIASLLGNNFRATGIFDGASATLYFNDIMSATLPISGTVINNSNSLKIGFSPSGSTYYPGDIDECLLLNKGFINLEIKNAVNSD